MPVTRRPATASALLVVLLLVTSCSGGGKKKADSTPSATPTPVVTTSAAPTTDPLTGLSTISTAPLVGVKIDNGVLAWPYQTGLGRAALVYEELVEGGATRLLAVYESDLAGAGEVGPIRSVRESDVELVRQYGGMAVAFSGGNTGVKAIVSRAARAGYLVDGSYDRIPQAYRLGTRRKDARNFFAAPATVARLKPGSTPHDIGMVFGPAGPAGVPTASAVSSYSPMSRVTVRYDAATGTWSVAQNTHLVSGAAPTNIIIQRVRERASGFRDVHGMNTPYTSTIGKGDVTILRDGRRYVGTWDRHGYGATHFLDASGKDIPLRPGRTWVLLVPTTGSVSFS
ncbi:MAG: putative secreted protein [Frankiales bacterium]|nr:putative secreted protein [Frankiales bacterium]